MWAILCRAVVADCAYTKGAPHLCPIVRAVRVRVARGMSAHRSGCRAQVGISAWIWAAVPPNDSVRVTHGLGWIMVVSQATLARAVPVSLVAVMVEGERGGAVMTDSRHLVVAIAAGGTAGHVNPALALADELRSRGHEVHFFGETRRLAVSYTHLCPPWSGWAMTKSVTPISAIMASI